MWCLLFKEVDGTRNLSCIHLLSNLLGFLLFNHFTLNGKYIYIYTYFDNNFNISLFSTLWLILLMEGFSPTYIFMCQSLLKFLLHTCFFLLFSLSYLSAMNLLFSQDSQVTLSIIHPSFSYLLFCHWLFFQTKHIAYPQIFRAWVCFQSVSECFCWFVFSLLPFIYILKYSLNYI